MIATQDDLADDKPRDIPVLVTTSVRDSERNWTRRRSNAERGLDCIKRQRKEKQKTKQVCWECTAQL